MVKKYREKSAGVLDAYVVGLSIDQSGATARYTEVARDERLTIVSPRMQANLVSLVPFPKVCRILGALPARKTARGALPYWLLSPASRYQHFEPRTAVPASQLGTCYVVVCNQLHGQGATDSSMAPGKIGRV